MKLSHYKLKKLYGWYQGTDFDNRLTIHHNIIMINAVAGSMINDNWVLEGTLQALQRKLLIGRKVQERHRQPAERNNSGPQVFTSVLFPSSGRADCGSRCDQDASRERGFRHSHRFLSLLTSVTTVVTGIQREFDLWVSICCAND